jgi:ubiquitin C-terminal hydrolase
MPPKKRSSSVSAKLKSLDVSGRDALALKNDLEGCPGKSDISDISASRLARILGIRSGCHEEGEGCKGNPLNPGCLCGLVPVDEGKYRKTGLWSKAAKKRAEDDEPPERRNGEMKPGLENLGNTCYINSVLQCLFAVDDFKCSVLEAWRQREEKSRGSVAVAPDESEALHNVPENVLEALKDIFVKLECGPESIVDPAPLITALRLDSSVQQDGHEFMKLFLSLLEKVPGLSSLSLFRGRSGYHTRCMSCGQLSQSSLRFDDFLELDIPIKGFSGLQESLGTLLCPEILDGDNQYFCANCDAKQDATRQLIVKDLPSVLCLSLQRFVFDLKKMDRVKANDKFSFPLELQASMITHEGSDVYDLEGILLHKGSSARQGHYVAHINKDKKWYRFDDGDVTILEKGPQGHPDHGKIGGGKPGAKKTKKARRKKVTKTKLDQEGPIDLTKQDVQNTEQKDPPADLVADVQPEPEENWAQCENPSCNKWRILPPNTKLNAEEPWYCHMNPDQKHNSCDAPEEDWDREEYEREQREAGLVTSSNAYLLVYKKRNDVKQQGVSSQREMQNGFGAWMADQKRKLDEEFQKTVDAHKKIVDDTHRAIDRRRKLVRDVLESSKKIEEGEDEGLLVTLSWLESWVNSEPKDSISAIDNSALLCPHDKLDPSKVQASKRLSTGAWQQLYEMYGGGPMLGASSTCRDCLLEQLDSILLAEDVEVNRELYLDLCDKLDLDASRGASGKKHDKGSGSLDVASPTEGSQKQQSAMAGFYVGKSWLRNWRNRKGSSMGSSSPTSSLICEHGMLVPAHPGRPSTRVLIPPDFWAYLKRSWCAKVAVEDRKDRFKQAEMPDKRKNQIKDVRAKDDRAATRAGTDLLEFPHDAPECPECKQDLDSHIETHPRREEEKAALKNLVSASQSLILEPDLMYKMVPVEFLNEWRSYMGPSKTRDPKTIPSLAQYMLDIACTNSAHSTSPKIAFAAPPLVNRRGRWMYTNGSDAVFEIIEEADWNKIWASYGEEGVQFGEGGISAFLRPIVTPGQEGENNTEEGRELLMECVTSPELCEECILDREKAIRASLLNFQGQEIMVEMVADEAAAKELSSAVDSSALERKSKRARKGRAPIVVDSTTSLENAKLRMFEALSVHPKNVRAFLRGTELVDDAKTMMEYEIVPSDELKIVDTGEFDPNDLSSIFPDVVITREDDKELEGFGGTALHGMHD